MITSSAAKFCGDSSFRRATIVHSPTMDKKLW
jgi:hypothetical protein